MNNKRMHIASRQVRGGDKVRVEYHLEALSKAKQKHFELLDSDILFDAHNVIAINKPPGLPSQATRDQDVMHAEVCLSHWLKKNNRPSEKLILLHRLDKETSGVLLFATLGNTATWISEQFRERELGKNYLALCYGLPANDTFIEECYLSEIDKKSGLVSVVRSGGKSSKTKFTVLKRNKSLGISFIECRPETGRSHQIRVHLEHAGHGILGDKRYGLNQRIHLPQETENIIAQHHMLHAQALKFTPAPGLPPVEVIAKAPDGFLKIQSKLFE